MVGNWMDRRSFPGEERGCANPLVEFFFFFLFVFFFLETIRYSFMFN